MKGALAEGEPTSAPAARGGLGVRIFEVMTPPDHDPATAPPSSAPNANASRRLWATILAGGVGARFWPASTPDRPKQLLPLAGPRPLVVDALRRAEGVVSPDRVRILAPTDLAGPIGEATGLGPDAFFVEPQARGTGPALARAAWEIAQTDPAAVMISLHADHLLRPEPAFRETVLAAAEIAAREQLLVTVASPPDRPETGYGYIRPGRPLAAPPGVRSYRVEGFVEKPAADEAERLVAAGARWNAGIFVWPVQVFLDEAAARSPEMAGAMRQLDEGDVAAFFERCRPVSVDEAVLERSPRVGAVDALFEWDDVGSWESLARTRTADRHGNVLQGDVVVADASGNIAVAERGRVVLLGVDDLLVVRADDTTLVMPRRESPHLKRYLDALPGLGRPAE